MIGAQLALLLLAAPGAAAGAVCLDKQRRSFIAASLAAKQEQQTAERPEKASLPVVAEAAVKPKATGADLKARAKAESLACVNNLKQIGLAARIYANDQGDVFPASFVAMSNVLSTPKLLICPGDKARVAAKNWQEFGPANVSYEFLNPGGSETNPYVLLTRCPVHGNVGLSDGSVWQGVGLGRSFTIAVKDGKQIFTPLNPPANASPFE